MFRPKKDGMSISKSPYASGEGQARRNRRLSIFLFALFRAARGHRQPSSVPLAVLATVHSEFERSRERLELFPAARSSEIVILQSAAAKTSCDPFP